MRRLAILVAILALIQNVQCDTPVSESGMKSCYYCGIKDNCELPYDKDDGERIQCDKSCLKFDGQAKDGKRIVVRNCGYFTADECIHGASYEDTDTIGTICHCLEPDCNSAQLHYVNNISAFLVAFVVSKII